MLTRNALRTRWNIEVRQCLNIGLRVMFRHRARSKRLIAHTGAVPNDRDGAIGRQSNTETDTKVTVVQPAANGKRDMAGTDVKSGRRQA